MKIPFIRLICSDCIHFRENKNDCTLGKKLIIKKGKNYYYGEYDPEVECVDFKYGYGYEYFKVIE